MTTAEVQALLRFLTKDAKITLAEALPKVGLLREHGFNTPSSVAEASPGDLKQVFTDDKILKQVTNAAKRISNPKKRTAAQAGLSQSQRLKPDGYLKSQDPEAELALPTTDAGVEELEQMEIETNRAPLVLAFAIVVQEYTMPEQPLSSRLSLAHAVVSVNSQSKAKSIGLTSGDTAEEEGWTKGQPRLKVLNREIAVMRRHIHPTIHAGESQETIKTDGPIPHEAFWGLDLDALRKSNGPLVAGQLAGSQGPPIHTPQAARSYLLKSITTVTHEANTSDPQSGEKKKKRSAAELIAAKEQATASLLKSLRLLCESWTSTLSAEDLDKRAWSWYLTVRPDVAQGQSGWGQRGRVRLADILKLRRKA